MYIYKIYLFDLFVLLYITYQLDSFIITKYVYTI